MCAWNLQKLAEAWQPHLSTADAADALAAFKPQYEEMHLAIFRNKLGLSVDEARAEEDKALVVSLLSTMKTCATDFTNTFRVLAAFVSRGASGEAPAADSASQVYSLAVFNPELSQFNPELSQFNPDFLQAASIREAGEALAANSASQEEMVGILRRKIKVNFSPTNLALFSY